MSADLNTPLSPVPQGFPDGQGRGAGGEGGAAVVRPQPPLPNPSPSRGEGLRRLSNRTVSCIKATLFLACLLPLARLLLPFYAALTGTEVLGYNGDELGANPIEFIIRDLGTWALNFLLITLCVTPLRKFTGLNWLLRLRRMLGLFAFFYALMHFNIYLGLDQSYDWAEIAIDILKRPFITVGMLTFALMIPLAVTSNAAMIKALGGKAWQKLHMLIYPLTMLAMLHYWWLIKLDTTQPAIYAALLSILLGLRLYWWWSARPRH